MSKLFLLAAVAALAGCSQQPAAEPEADANMAAEADVAADPNASASNAAGTALASINETTWEFTRDGKPQRTSVDASGNYITNSGSEHIDHGTAVMKDGKACFTSAMNKDGEICWSDPKLAEGGSGESTNNKGETIALKRTAYVPLTM